MAFLATELSDKINGYLSEMPYMREPKGLYAPIEYVLSLGGKRIMGDNSKGYGDRIYPYKKV